MSREGYIENFMDWELILKLIVKAILIIRDKIIIEAHFSVSTKMYLNESDIGS